jgi:hypothetical protein
MDVDPVVCAKHFSLDISPYFPRPRLQGGCAAPPLAGAPWAVSCSGCAGPRERLAWPGRPLRLAGAPASLRAYRQLPPGALRAPGALASLRASHAAWDANRRQWPTCHRWQRPSPDGHRGNRGGQPPRRATAPAGRARFGMEEQRRSRWGSHLRTRMGISPQN